MRLRTVLLPLLFAALQAQAEFRFPMPEFAEGYEHPVIKTPLQELQHSSMTLDVIVLALCLVLGSWLLLKKRSRRGTFLLTLFSLAYFGFWRHGCVCSVGALQNVTDALMHPAVGVSIGVLIFFLLPLITALFFGRIFCAAICPLGALQEVVALKPIKVPRALEAPLRFLPVIYLGLTVLSIATGAGYLICRFDPFVGFFRRGASLEMLLFGGAMLLLGVFVARPYCRFLCPYGVLLKWMSHLSRRHVSIAPSNDQCINCRLCADACPYGAIEESMPEQAPESLKTGASRVKKLLLLLPLWMLLGALAGWALQQPLSKMHYTVRLAERVAAEELGYVQDQTLDSEMFRSSDTTIEELYAAANLIKADYARLSPILGLSLGLLLGLSILSSAVWRKREGFEPHKGNCLSCGRCFKYCPVTGEPDEN